MSIFNNYPLIAGLSAFFFTQLFKLPIAYLMGKKITAKLVVSTGGMPSSHSAGVTSLFTALVIRYGISSPLVAISGILGLIVIYDAMNVRRQSGEQAILLRKFVTELQQTAIDEDFNNKDAILNLSNSLRPISLGHKPSEVFIGIISGALLAIIINYLFYA